MKVEDREILVELLERQDELATRPAVPVIYGNRQNVLDRVRDGTERELGAVTWKVPEWFGDLAEPIARRYQRAVHRLEKAGLLEAIRYWRGNVTHVKLTDAGRSEAERLVQEQAASVEGG